MAEEKNRVDRLVAVMMEFVKESDWMHERNHDEYNARHVKKNKYITGMQKRSTTKSGSIPIDDINFGWNYQQGFGGGRVVRKRQYVATGAFNLMYDREDENMKALRIVQHLDDWKTYDFYEDQVGYSSPSLGQIRKAVEQFWVVIDAHRDEIKGDTGKYQLSDMVENYCDVLKNAHNIIFRGAPGTGKTYLAKAIASAMISGNCEDYIELTAAQQAQIGFVQFHPSYDYADFVEGLRPVATDGTMSFAVQPGTFKRFVEAAKEQPKQAFVFIIDEINRGEINKIFGELFYAIDPGYRGPAGAVATQYQSMHPNEPLFYIPENVYIIGTMNDIDRSVDTFDFAMRRRFRFINITPEARLTMLDDLKDAEAAKTKLQALNAAICAHSDLNADYQVGPAYFTHLDDINFAMLWADYLEPLLRDYLRGGLNVEDDLKTFKRAYDGDGND